MSFYAKKSIPAADLRAITLIAIESMKDPANCTLEHLAQDRNGNSVSVFSDKAVILGDIGHIYRAAMQHFGFKDMYQISDRDDKTTNTLNCVVRDLDAQIRFVGRKTIDGEDVFTSMVTVWVDDGPEVVTRLLKEVAQRLELGGDAMSVLPKDVGVMVDIPSNKKKRRRGVPSEESFDDEDGMLEEDEEVGC